jgi:hypothetical protein
MESTLINSACAGIRRPTSGQAIASSSQRPVVLVERENAVVRLAQGLAVDRREVRLRIEVDQQRRRNRVPPRRRD